MAVNLSKIDSLLPEAKNLVRNESGATQVNTYKIRYTWKICDFSFCPLNERLASPTFHGRVKTRYSWRLAVTLEDSSSSNSRTISVRPTLIFVPGEIPTVSAKSRFVYFNPTTENTENFGDIDYHFFSNSKPTKTYPWLLCEKSNSRFHDTSLSEDIRIIVCDMIIYENYTDTVEKCISEASEESEYFPMLEYIKDLFESPELCDVTLITSGATIRAHKLVLAARSSVFKAMFHDDTKENEKNEVDISDVANDVMIEILRFIYTGEASRIDEIAEDLLVAAHKYALWTLKNQCGKELCKKITIGNAINLLKLADCYGEAILKRTVLNFICANAKDIICTDNYQSMHNTHPHLLDEAFRNLATNTP